MELTAATLAIRTANMLLRELEYTINETLYWTDSMSVLRYIANETTKFHTFVANRITVIREASSIHQWRYVETSKNPADYSSHGMNMKKLLACNSLFNGPEFLTLPEENWPPEFSKSTQLNCNNPEIKKPTVTAASCDMVPSVMDRLLAHYSDWSKLKKTVSWILIAMANLKRKSEQRQLITKEVRDVGDPHKQDVMIKARMETLYRISQDDIKRKLKDVSISTDIYAQAERVLLRYEQNRFCKEEIELLTSNTSIKKSSSILKLDPIVVDGLLRAGGRLAKSDLTCPPDSWSSRQERHDSFPPTEILDNWRVFSHKDIPIEVCPLQEVPVAYRTTENG